MQHSMFGLRTGIGVRDCHSDMASLPRTVNKLTIVDELLQLLLIAACTRQEHNMRNSNILMV